MFTNLKVFGKSPSRKFCSVNFFSIITRKGRNVLNFMVHKVHGTLFSVSKYELKQ